MPFMELQPSPAASSLSPSRSFLPSPPSLSLSLSLSLSSFSLCVCAFLSWDLLRKGRDGILWGRIVPTRLKGRAVLHIPRHLSAADRALATEACLRHQRRRTAHPLPFPLRLTHQATQPDARTQLWHAPTHRSKPSP